MGKSIYNICLVFIFSCSFLSSQELIKKENQKGMILQLSRLEEQSLLKIRHSLLFPQRTLFEKAVKNDKYFYLLWQLRNQRRMIDYIFGRVKIIQHKRNMEKEAKKVPEKTNLEKTLKHLEKGLNSNDFRRKMKTLIYYHSDTKRSYAKLKKIVFRETIKSDTKVYKFIFLLELILQSKEKEYARILEGFLAVGSGDLKKIIVACALRQKGVEQGKKYLDRIICSPEKRQKLFSLYSWFCHCFSPHPDDIYYHLIYYGDRSIGIIAQDFFRNFLGSKLQKTLLPILKNGHFIGWYKKNKRFLEYDRILGVWVLHAGNK